MMIEEGGRGGVADYTVGLVSALAGAGQPVELVTANDHLLDPPANVEVLGWFPYVRDRSALGRLIKRARLSRLVNGVGFVLTYLRCLPRARRARLIHIQGGTSFPLVLLAVLLFRALGKVVVHTPHNTFERGSRPSWARRPIEHLVQLTIIHVEADRPFLSPAARSVVIPHGDYTALAEDAADVDPLDARRGLGIPDDAPVTLVFGQLREDKGIDDVLRAALELPELVVLIVGEEAGGLAAAADLLSHDGLVGRVVVREGFLSMDDAAPMFAAADTVTLAYRQASQSGVLMLAYGFSRPVVVYPSGGMPEAVLAGETGWVCERAAAGSLAETFREVIAAGRPECRRRGLAGKRLSLQRFSWTEVAGRTLSAYRSVASADAPVGSG